MRPAELFSQTLGVSAMYKSDDVDLLVGVGDAGYYLRRDHYHTIASGGLAVRLHLSDHLEVGAGAEGFYEPGVQGDCDAPYFTPNVRYEDFVRQEVLKHYLEANPGRENLFPHPIATSSTSWKAVFYLGFGGVGPLRWNNLFANALRHHPDTFYTETSPDSGRAIPIYVQRLTDQRYEINVGDEMQLTLVPGRLDAVLGFLYGNHFDLDNQIAPSDADQTFWSTVARVQLYITDTVHLLGETSFAREISHNGNRYRQHADSVFQNTGGVADSRGLEYGDSPVRVTWQGKFGVVLNPLGPGIFTRPSLRLLYGVQYSTQNNAFGNSFVESLDEFNYFGSPEQHWHHLISAGGGGMVLTRRARARVSFRWVLGTLVSVVIGACPVAHNPPATVPPGSHTVAVAFAVDAARDCGVAVPPELHQTVRRVLSARNLGVVEVPTGDYGAAFAAQRLSRTRLARLAQVAHHADLLLLVETFPRYYSQLGGRFRWTVQVRLTLARKTALGDALSDDFTVPVFLDYPHQHERAALASAAASIGRELSSRLDDFLPALTSSDATSGGAQGAPTGTGARSAPAPAPAPSPAPGAAPPAPPGGPARGPSADRSTRDAIYFLMVDRFADGDPSNDRNVDRHDASAWHGGDLQGVLDHLDWLERLGVRTVWLSPVFITRSAPFYGHGAFHGYWVWDLGHVDPRFGSDALLGRLVQALHRRGMRLLLDMVLNHVGYGAPLASEHPDWFHHHGFIEDWNDPAQLVDRDVDGLPDLAQERPDVYAFLLHKSLHWVDDVPVDGFRLDAVKHASTRFWARYDDALRAKAGPGFTLLGEELDGDPAVIARFFREGHFGALFDFPLSFAMSDVFCKAAPPGRIAAVLSEDRLYRDPSHLVTLLDNHDLPRITTTCHGDLERVKQALLFELTARGTPSITYGTEIAMEGAHEPDNRGDMRFVSDAPLGAFIARVLDARASSPALRTGVTRLERLDGPLFAYSRLAPDDAALIAINEDTVSRRMRVPADIWGAASGGIDLLDSDADRGRRLRGGSAHGPG